MKTRSISLLLAACLLLSGCSSMLEREYIQVTPHNAAPATEGDSSILRADSYQELVNALLYLVTAGAEAGAVRLYMDSEDIEADVEAACLEVARETPLGAYSVEYIKYSVTSVVTYCEAEVQITYRRTREQVESIVSVTGVTAIRSELRSALTTFSPERVLRISYFNEGESFIRSLAREAYYSNPATALDLPDMAVSVYPGSGRQRIVEIELNYHLDRPELERRQQVLAQTLRELAASLPAAQGDEQILDAAQAVLDAGTYDPRGGASAYHALHAGRANSEGLALAMAALCQQLDVPCQVAEGVLDGAPHFWNVVTTEEGWRHLDLTRFWRNAPFATDRELTEDGYRWIPSSIPQCGPTEEPEAPEEKP